MLDAFNFPHVLNQKKWRLPTLQFTQQTAQTIAHDTWTTLIYNTVEIDDVGHGPISTSGQIRLPSQFNMFRAVAYAVGASNSSGARGQRILFNGLTTSDNAAGWAIKPAKFEHIPQVVTRWVPYKANDYIVAQVWQNTFGNLSIGGNGQWGPTWISLEFDRNSNPDAFSTFNAYSKTGRHPSLQLELVASQTVSTSAWTRINWLKASIDDLNIASGASYFLGASTYFSGFYMPNGFNRVRFRGHVSTTGGLTLQEFFRIDQNGVTIHGLTRNCYGEGGMDYSTGWFEAKPGDFFDAYVIMQTSGWVTGSDGIANGGPAWILAEFDNI